MPGCSASRRAPPWDPLCRRRPGPGPPARRAVRRYENSCVPHLMVSLLLSKALHVLQRFGPEQFLPVGAARLPAVIGVNQRVVPKPRQVHEHVFERPHARVLPHFVGVRATPRAALQHFVRRPVPHVDPAAIGTPAGHPRRPALTEPPVRVADRGIEPLPRLVVRRPRRRIPLGPELPQPRPLPFDRERRVHPLLAGAHQINQRSVQLVQLPLGHPVEQVHRLGHRRRRGERLEPGDPERGPAAHRVRSSPTGRLHLQPVPSRRQPREIHRAFRRAAPPPPPPPPPAPPPAPPPPPPPPTPPP